MLDIKLKLERSHTSERSWMTPTPLRTLFWNATYACNYRCGICFTDSGARRGELTTEEAREMVSRAHADGVKDIIISGGEPFLRSDLVDVLSHMGRLGMSARIASNGSLLTDELLTRLRAETDTKSFQISLDTLDPDLYAAIHGVPAGAFSSALGALGRIRKHGFHTTVSVRLGPQTLSGIPDLLGRARAEGWATVTVHCPVLTRRKIGAYPQKTDVLTLLEPVFERFLSLPERWLVETYIPWAEYHPAMKRLQREIRVVHRGCAAGRDHLTVNPGGEISPCVCWDCPAACIGNVRRDTFRDVFENAPLCRVLRRPWEHGICSRCPNVSNCGGGCRAAAYAISGRIDGQDESCPVWQARQVKAGPHEP
jgi:radical SAM protein with 4Fe4S-binding SPASM domain